MTTDAEAAQELLDHANRIESGELHWVPHYPKRAGECCVAFWILPDDTGVFLGDYLDINERLERRESLSNEAMNALLDALDWTDPTTSESDGDIGPQIGAWNDQPDVRTQAQVVRALKRAHRDLVAKDAE